MRKLNVSILVLHVSKFLVAKSHSTFNYYEPLDSSNMSNKEPEVLSRHYRIDLLLKHLSDGEFHSGETLGHSIGVSRAAIWKYIQVLEAFGLVVDSLRGRGYRIEGGLNLLDEQIIKSRLQVETLKHICEIEIFRQIDSTNQYLLDKVELGENMHGYVCLAEQQSAGRGRRGRVWVSPFAQNIYCSLQWRFEKGMQALEGLSLVVALAIVEALQSCDIQGLALKWPNDIMAENKKLAGILLEVRGDLTDCCDVVIGFGINVGMSAKSGEAIDQAWIALDDFRQKVFNRNDLLPPILDQMIKDLRLFEHEGFSVFQQRWNRLDAYMGKTVKIIAGKDQQLGIERGVNQQGALLLESNGVLKAFHGGELSLRGADEALV